jgi:hypothetical protein
MQHGLMLQGCPRRSPVCFTREAAVLRHRPHTASTRDATQLPRCRSQPAIGSPRCFTEPLQPKLSRTDVVLFLSSSSPSSLPAAGAIRLSHNSAFQFPTPTVSSPCCATPQPTRNAPHCLYIVHAIFFSAVSPSPP